MSISRDDVRDSIEQFVPRTANFSRSSDLGELNRDQIFDRLIHIVLSALLVDPDAVFFSVYLSAQRLQKEVTTSLEALADLDSLDQLRGISPLLPIRIENLDKLEDAQNSLLGMSAALVDNVFGINQFNSFSEDIIAFLIENIVPNVRDGGNNEKSSIAIRGSLAELADAWEAVLVRKSQLTEAVGEYEDLDLRVQVSSTVISAIRTKLQTLQETLPTLATTEQGAQSEQIMIDLVSAVESLKIIALSPSPFGDTVLGPLENGFTEAEYLLTEGVATIEPILPLMKGEDGKLYFDSVLVSTTGQTVSDGDETTAIFSDPTVSDFTETVSPFQYLTLVDSGERYRIRAVLEAALTLDGETTHVPASPKRYVVTQTPPGTYFRSESSEFWDEFSTGSTESTVFLSGTEGEWERIDKVRETDGKNIKASGTSATLRPFKSNGVDGLMNAGDPVFIGQPGTTFLTDGVIPGDLLFVEGFNAPDNPHVVDFLLSQTQFQITTNFTFLSVDTWLIEEADAESRVSFDGDAFSEGLEVGDFFHVLTGSQIGSYEILEILDSSTLLLDGVFTSEENVDWEVHYSDTTFISESGNFLSGGVQPGDILSISTVGVFTVLTVDSQKQLTVSSSIGSFFPNKHYAIYEDSPTTTKFNQGDLNFDDEGVAAFIDGVQVILQAEAVGVNVVQLDPEDPGQRLRVDTEVLIDPGPLVWSLRVGDETTSFTDTSGPFADYEPGDIIVYRPGSAGERRVGIQEIVNANQVVLAGPLPQGEANIPYAVISVCKPGVQLIVSGRRHTVVDVLDQHTLEVRPPLALTVGKEIEFLIVRSGSTPLTYRLVDLPTAQSFGPDGFPESIVGSEFELMGGQQVKGRVTARIDADEDTQFESFNVTPQMQIGQREAAYRLRTLISNTTNKFRAQTSISPSPGDILTIWGQNSPFEILSVSVEGSIRVFTVDGLLPARLEDQSFIVVRGGSRHHGRYLLLEDKLAELSQDSDTSALRLAVAEVLIDFGSNITPIASGVGADLSFDDDGDEKTSTITIPGATFISDGVVFGHRVDLLYPGSIPRRSYVVEVINETTLTIDPPLPATGTTLPWSISRSSVSNALSDLQALQVQMEDLQEVLSAYVVEQNATVLNTLNLLKKHRMDRAIDLFYDGKMTEFVEMESTESSYSSQARSAIQVVGGSTSPAESVSSGNPQNLVTGNDMSGIDPATGKSSPSRHFASATQSQARGVSEVETRIALSKAVTDLVADEQIRSMLQFSLDEARNRGIYELNGEIQSGVISDQDPTLPWLDKTGSVKDRLIIKAEEALAAIQYMLDNPAEFEDVAAEGENVG